MDLPITTKTRQIKQQLGITLTILGLSVSQVSHSVETNAWEFEVTPYLFAADLNGKVGVRGVTSDVNTSFSDVLKNLDYGFMGLLTARKGPWTYGLETVYIQLSDQTSKNVTGLSQHGANNAELNITSKMSIYQGSVAYRILDKATAVDLLGALRYTKLATSANISITSDTGTVFPGGRKSASGSASWTDAVVGIRATHRISDKTALFAYADIGGGGSNLTYQFMLGANFDFAKNYSVKVGYRQLYWDYKKHGDVWNVRLHGPYLGMGIRF